MENKRVISIPIIEASFIDDAVKSSINTHERAMVKRDFAVIQGIAFFKSSGLNSNTSHVWFPHAGLAIDYSNLRCSYLDKNQKDGLRSGSAWGHGWIIKVGSFSDYDSPTKYYIQRVMTEANKTINNLKKEKNSLQQLMHDVINEDPDGNLDKEDLAYRFGNAKLAAISACMALHTPEDSSFWTQTTFGRNLTESLQKAYPDYFQIEISCNTIYCLNKDVCTVDKIAPIINEFTSIRHGYLFNGDMSTYTNTINNYPTLNESPDLESLNGFIETLPKKPTPKSTPLEQKSIKESLKKLKDPDIQGPSKGGCNIM